MPGPKIIVVCGYPKSGTTWLSRLVAELVRCPLRGNWGYPPQNPGDTEGLDRQSAYACYKSHHAQPALAASLNGIDAAVICIVRDPRDIVISAMHHFAVLPAWLDALARPLPFVRRPLRRALPAGFGKRRMIDAVLSGDATVNEWLSLSWKEYYDSYRQSEALLVRYEDLLADPRSECRGILASLGLERSAETIDDAVRRQSFAARKAEFAKSGDAYQFGFLRSGGSEYWRDELTATEKSRFGQQLAEDLRSLSYAVE